MVTPPFWFAVFFVALGWFLAGAMYMQARSPDPHPVFASRAWRSTIWIVAFSAQTWLHAHGVAMARTQRKPLPTLADSEREARKLGYGLIALGLLVWIGYWLASRWLGIWLLPVGFLVVLVVGILKTFRPRKDGHTRSLNPAESHRWRRSRTS